MSQTSATPVTGRGRGQPAGGSGNGKARVTAGRSRTGWTLALASVGAFMAALDVVVVATALPTLRAHLGASLSDLEWTINAYNLVFACLMLTGAALGVAALLVWRMRWAGGVMVLPAAVFGGAAVLLAGAALLCGRLGAPRAAVDGAAWAAVIGAVLAGASAPPGASWGKRPIDRVSSLTSCANCREASTTRSCRH